MKAYSSFQPAYLALLSDLRDHGVDTASVTDPTSVGSRFGDQPRGTRELIGAGFVLTNPQARLLDLPARRMDLSYAIANVLWTLSGSSNAGDIAPYNPRGLAFTADGINLACAVGARLFRSSAGDQIDNAVRLLREHPGTRRAIAVVGDPSDTQLTPRDFPCQLGIQFLLRDRHLHCVVAMRSQSAALVLPYDVFLHTMLQELVAREIGAELGDYHHVCFSAHYYTDEAALVERILGAPRGVDPAPMPPMPRSDRELLCRVESQMRGSEDPVNTLYRAGLDPYWAELLLLVARRLASSAA